MLKIIQRRKIWFGISIITVVVSVACLFSWNLNLGIDFTGGTLMEFSFSSESRVLSQQEIKNQLADLELGEINIQSSGERGVILRFKEVDEETHQKILSKLKGDEKEESGEKVKIEAVDGEGVEIKDIKIETNNVNEDSEIGNPEDLGNEVKINDANNESGEEINVNLVDGEETIPDNDSLEGNNASPTSSQEGSAIEIIEKRFESIGPVIGGELKKKSVKAILMVLIGIVLYVGWVFRKVSRPVSSWKYGIIALVALFHDIIITLGVFSILGHFYGIEIGMPFVVALLTILGYSVNDTIVVFDRTRENLLRSAWDDFEEVVNRSVNETLIRSVNTSLTTLVVLLAVYFFGGATIQYFILALIIGIVAGTYSSIFIASPLLVSLARRRKK